MKPNNLPVYTQRTKILEKISSNQVIVVESPTGSGKTTQIPQILYHEGYADSGIIGITQPRRIAAVSVSKFIATQMNVTIPGIVGYKMRFEDKTDENVKIKVMTDGILLQEIKADYNLDKYSMIIVDEAHERSLNIDFILGLLKRILELRPDFKVIISSATINAQVFSEYFDGCPIVNIDSIVYPVEVIFSPLEGEQNFDSLMEKIGEIVTKVHSEKREGDILIFLSGEKAIKTCSTLLTGMPYAGELEILPLYSRLSSEDQEKIFLDYPGKRKVIVATNIAETSVTIDGITTVIDSGFAKMNFYNPRTFTSSLIEIPISKAASNQRKGRAGRTQPGVCYRLYTHEDYEKRQLFTLEEIFRTDLSEVVLRMAEIGIRNFENFDFLSSPSREGIISAIETLMMLEAIDKERSLTSIGKMMVLFPLLPRQSRIIVEAIQSYPDVLEEVLIATAFLSTNSPFLLPQGLEIEARKAHHFFRDNHGDFVSYLKLYRAFKNTRDKSLFCEEHFLDLKTMHELVNIKNQLEEIVSAAHIPISSGGPFREYLSCIARGLIQFVCINSGRGIFRSLTAGKIMIHPGSVMFRKNPRFIVAGEIVKTSRMYARSVSELREEWLHDISPLLDTLFKTGTETKKNKSRDFTNNIKIGKSLFRIDKRKGNKKTVILPWEKLKPLLKNLDISLLPHYKGLHGKITIGPYEFLEGISLNTLLHIATKIRIPDKITKNWPRRHYDFHQDLKNLIQSLTFLLTPCKKKKNDKKLGFLTLFTDSKGKYWFKPMKNFYTSVSESLSSLEILADDADETLEKRDRETINELYRKLSGMFNN
ncbi:MAG: ATP-dependent RNA helicase [Spirochaetales bacterium]|nr:ATP-dependent RNA helicase [Spirochaetales bacterium]